MAVVTDSAQSAEFRRSLESYLHNVVSADGRFCCESAEECSRSIRPENQFASGQLSYVGDGYAASIDDTPFRVLVVSMQVGDAEAPVTMARRQAQIQTRVNQPPASRNPHMRGVTYALQLLYGRDPEPRLEHLDDGTHVLDAYAMANSTLCSNLPTAGASRRGAPSKVMTQLCARHLRETVRILRPTVIHSQGRTTRGLSTHTAVKSVLDECTDVSEWNARVRIDGVETVWCSLPHPAAGAPFAWQWTSTAFFRDVVAPTLRDARELALDASTP